MIIPAFQRAGQFNPAVYEQTLLRNHWTPQRFEEAERLRILTEKAKAAVQVSVALLPEEIPAPPPPVVETPQSDTPPPTGPSAATVLQQKEQRALMAFIANVRSQTPVTIAEESL